MGLDMYFVMEDDDGQQTEMAYFRKHSDLHGWFIDNVANGVDECQPIEINRTHIAEAREAVESHSLPLTRGFFFGASTQDDDEVKYTLDQLRIIDSFMHKHPSAKFFYIASW